MDWLSGTDSFVSIIAGAMAIYATVQLWRKKNSALNQKLENRTCPAQRFLDLFEAHGVAKSQVPAFFDRGLTISDCSSPTKLLEKLTDELLQDAANLFAVNIDWLYGTTDEVYNIHQFYKHPEYCKGFVEALKSEGCNLTCYALWPNKSLTFTDSKSAIVMMEEIGCINDRPIHRLHILGGWVHSYWKCRGYYAACTSIIMNNDIRVFGKTIEVELLTHIANGTRLPAYNFDNSLFDFTLGEPWLADDFIDNPECYLQGISPETDNFGLHAAIDLWLNLEEQGHLIVTKYSNPDYVRALFHKFEVRV
ncbi:hypothetical protein N474_11360 [Pseudoalteromonas luteoviolacea CPMOR-2]|uniref:hypothetical protein n=1 Tax=Pseudoalteromonas luteoviolacea TaxID=43657 RepID=UPI0007B03DEF|nr:hypothetical protein [Pseudoalteromonas luteoviolacea]KZN56335.1 hypothetical protein N474_11360 [Pseudoalteromonas luteoviolacea CPMOR-2]